MLAVTPFIMDPNFTTTEFPKSRIDVLKKSMTLNFAPGSSGGLLDSPDLKMVQLTSPDLENLIFQQSGILLQTPTPGALVRMISMRDDEKSDLRGFEEALAKMHSQRNAESLQQFSEGDYSLGHPISTECVGQSQVELVYSGAPSKRPFNEAIIENSAPSHAVSIMSHGTMHDDEQSRCSSATSSASFWSEEDSYSQRSVPRGASRGMKAGTRLNHSRGKGAGLVEPVDLNAQEKMRVERKRERNRVAARKCRERKIRKIDDLTSQVQKLESDKKAMAVRLNRLQAEISRLRGAIQDHAHSGCKVPLGSR